MGPLAELKLTSLGGLDPGSGFFLGFFNLTGSWTGSDSWIGSGSGAFLLLLLGLGSIALTSGSSEISTFLLRLRVSFGWGGASSILYIHTALYSSVELLEYQGEAPVSR